MSSSKKYLTPEEVQELTQAVADFNAEGQYEAADKIFQYMDNIYGKDIGPQIFSLGNRLRTTSGNEQLELLQQFEAVNKSFKPAKPKFKSHLDWGSLNPLEAFGVSAVNSIAKFFDPEGRINQWQSELSEEFPVAAGAGEFVGDMAPAIAGELALRGPLKQVASKLIPGKSYGAKATREFLKNQSDLAAAGVTGAALGALDPERSATEGAVSAMVGQKVGDFVIGKITKGGSGHPKEIANNIRKHKDQGFWVNPGLWSNKPVEKQLDFAIMKNSRTSNIVERKLAHNNALYTSKVANEIGLDPSVTSLTEPVLQTQLANLKSKAEEFYSTYVPKFVNPSTALTSTERSFKRATGTDMPAEYNRFKNRLENLVKLSKNKASHNLASAEAKTLRDDLSNIIEYNATAQSGNQRLNEAYLGMLNVLDESLIRAAGKGKLDDLRQVNRQQNFLYNLYGDKQMLTTGQPNPDYVYNMYRRRSGKIDPSEIKNRQDLWDATSFMINQKKSFVPNLSQQQRFGNVLNVLDPTERTGMFGGFSNLTRELPFVSSIPTRAYLSNLGQMLPAGSEEAAGLLAGAYGAAGAPSLGWVPPVIENTQEALGYLPSLLPFAPEDY